MALPVFEKDFDKDFYQVVHGLNPKYDGPPFAFLRLADGEARIMCGQKHNARSDHWKVGRGGVPELSLKLKQAMMFSCPGYYLGITSQSHHPKWHKWYTEKNIPTPAERITFAELFCFANYHKVRKLDLSHCFLISCKMVPSTPVHELWPRRMREVVREIQEKKKPTVIAAGPWAKVIIYEYWKSTKPSDRQVIVDIGSSLDKRIKRHRTRRHHNPPHPKFKWKPTWKKDSQLVPT